MRQSRTFHISHRKNPSRRNFNIKHLCPKYKGTHICKETLLKLKSHIDPYTLIVGDFNNPLSPMDSSDRQKINREIRELTDDMSQIE